MTSEGRGILSPVRLVAPWRKALQALDFQNRELPRITGICDLMVTVTVTVPVSRRLPNRPRATPERGRLPTVPWCTLCLSIANAAGTWGIGYVTGFEPW